MAFFDCHFFSDVLGLSVSAHVLIPQPAQRQIGMVGAVEKTTPSGGFPTLTLLHGLSDDHTIWMRRTSIERYAAVRGLAVVMPAASRSYYQDTTSGSLYWTFISEELPAILRGFFPLSTRREHNYVAGLSMGGYGALRLALAQPTRFAAAASFSGALDVVRRAREARQNDVRLNRQELQAIFGADLRVENTEADLYFLARQLASTDSERPALYLSCGTEDRLLAESRAFHQHLEALQIASIYREAPGRHEWGFWDAEIQHVIEWLPGLGTLESEGAE